MSQELHPPLARTFTLAKCQRLSPTPQHPPALPGTHSSAYFRSCQAHEVAKPVGANCESWGRGSVNTTHRRQTSVYWPPPHPVFIAFPIASTSPPSAPPASSASAKPRTNPSSAPASPSPSPPSSPPRPAAPPRPPPPPPRPPPPPPRRRGAARRPARGRS